MIEAMNLKLNITAAGLMAAALLSACNLPFGGQAPTATSSSAAAETVVAVQTRTGPSLEATGAALQSTAGSSAATTPTEITATITPGNIQAECDHKADFIDDVTVPDNAKYDAGDSFIKIWRLRNSGNCDWSQSFLLTFIGGTRLDAPNAVALSDVVAPGELIDLAVDMEAPQQAGTYQGFWKLRSPDGDFFGIGPQGDQSFWVKIVVPAQPTSQISQTPSATLTQTPSPTPTDTISPSPTASSTSTATASPTPTATATATFTSTPQ